MKNALRHVIVVALGVVIGFPVAILTAAPAPGPVPGPPSVLPYNSVGTPQLQNGAVTGAKIACPEGLVPVGVDGGVSACSYAPNVRSTTDILVGTDGGIITLATPVAMCLTTRPGFSGCSFISNQKIIEISSDSISLTAVDGGVGIFAPNGSAITLAGGAFSAASDGGGLRLVDSVHTNSIIVDDTGSISLTATNGQNVSITPPLPTSSGGTGSATQNFVDLTTAQSAAGTKTWTGAARFQNLISASFGVASTVDGLLDILNAGGGGITGLQATQNGASNVTFNLPGTNGTSHYPLTSDGAGNTKYELLPLSGGGTGSATQNFVDLTTVQTVAGTKTWSALANFSSVASFTTNIAEQIWLGVPSTTPGSLRLYNASNSNITVIKGGVASADITMTTPTDFGSGGAVSSDSGGQLSVGELPVGYGGTGANLSICPTTGVNVILGPSTLSCGNSGMAGDIAYWDGTTQAYESVVPITNGGTGTTKPAGACTLNGSATSTCHVTGLSTTCHCTATYDSTGAVSHPLNCHNNGSGDVTVTSTINLDTGDVNVVCLDG